MSIEITHHIQAAWQVCGIDYCNGVVNSERCLQASFYRALRSLLPEGYDVVVEPDWKGSIPDMVICQNLPHRAIVAIFELKFMPHTLVLFEDDIAKLRDTYLYGNLQHAYVDPKTGKWLPSIPIAHGALKIFAAVGNSESAGVYLDKISNKYPNKMPDNFRLLYGRVSSTSVAFGSEM